MTTNPHYLIIGLGITGLSSARWLSAQGAKVTVFDTRQHPALQNELTRTLPAVKLRSGKLSDDDFIGVDQLIVSPGVPLSTPAIARFKQSGGAVLGDVELWARAIATSSSRVIAITGSNGKSTTTELVGHLCRSAGLDTEVAGNIGLPVLDACLARQNSGKMPDIWVVELSSFQLDTSDSLKSDAATVLNISEDHLDRYASLLDYAHSKSRIFNHCRTQVLNADDPLVCAMRRADTQVKWFSCLSHTDYALQRNSTQQESFLTINNQRVFNLKQLPLRGRHNAANALAALALCQSVGLDITDLKSGLGSFQGLAHRMSFVCKIDEVDYINDSKGTNVGATVAALDSLSAPVVLIAGGEGKGQNFAPLVQACRHKIRIALLIGRDGPLMAKHFAQANIKTQLCSTLEAATYQAANLAQAGDIVLLSPACASTDMFCDYTERARVFIDTVHSLNSTLIVKGSSLC